MIRKFNSQDLAVVMQIWLKTNIEAHSFIPAAYWKNNFEEVKAALLHAEIYVAEVDGQIVGFIGLNQTIIEGIFVKKGMRSRGIGKQLLDYVKKIKPELQLEVYKENPRAIKFYEREQFIKIAEKVDELTDAKYYEMRWKNKQHKEVTQR
ncbi:MAG TPA: GNAT family N-acetyltransferase [Candidatus Ligilactobacillus faecavium]|nr:GNAT family N-acetyltransferase [Candidatus Ligilactobacillus faecavium]